MKRLTKLSRFAIIFLIGLSLLVPAVEAAENSFTDYQKGNFGFDQVSYLANEGIIQGYRDHSFRPTKEVNRAETAIMFQRALNLEAPMNGTSFKDVPEASLFADAAAAVKEAGIFKGTTDGAFGPGDLLTREQMASVLVRAFELKAISSVNVNLNDLAQVSSAHVNDVKVLFQNGITNGKANGLYDPKGSVSRAEFSVFMHRALTGQIIEQPIDDQVELAINHTGLTTTDGKINGQVTTDKEVVQITYDLRNESDQGIILAGTLSVSTDSTLTLTDIPSPINLFIENGTKQELKQGENNLAFADKMASTGVNFGMIRNLMGNFKVGGTLADKEGNVKDITIDFVVE